MRRNVDLVVELLRDNPGGYLILTNDPRDYVAPSFAIAFAFFRDAAFYAKKWRDQSRWTAPEMLRLHPKRMHYARCVRFDLVVGMESLTLALDEMLRR